MLSRRSPAFELIVVDNISTDAKRGFIERLASATPRVRAVFEPRRGLSHARNAGIRWKRRRRSSRSPTMTCAWRPTGSDDRAGVRLGTPGRLAGGPRAAMGQ
jgi:hypothetical protein